MTPRVGRAAAWPVVLAALTLGTCLSPGVTPHPQFIRQFYYVNDKDALRSLQENSANLSLVSPAWFSVTRSGAINSSLDSLVCDFAQSHSIALMPLVTNGAFDARVAHAMLTDEKFQETVLSAILRAASLRPFYGIQLDFENIDPADRDAYSRFAEKLGSALHNLHLQFSIAAPAPLTPAPPGPGVVPGSWIANEHAAAFDYQKLGEAADFLSLMTYDENTSPRRPGPVAETSWTEACVRKVLEQVPSRKILLGLPLYYRHWHGDLVEDGAYPRAEALAASMHVPISIDAGSGSATFQFSGEKGQHVVWLENALSLQNKLRLAVKYQLGGFAAWRLGQEDPVVWKGVFKRK